MRRRCRRTPVQQRIRSLATPAKRAARPRKVASTAAEGTKPATATSAKKGVKKGVKKSASKSSAKGSAADATLRLVLKTLDDMKAEDIVTLDLQGKTSVCDYMVVATGRSQRHAGSTADNVLKELSKAGIKGVRTEGMPQCDWVLIDAGDVIVHLFRDEVRTFYNLEKMWTGGPATDKAKT